MDKGINFNPQVSFGMRQNLKAPEIIQRRAKQVYQHISPVIFFQKTEQAGSLNQDLLLKLKLMMKDLMNFRGNLLKSSNPEECLIEYFRNGGKIANGGEETILATIIGKMNGQKNIYNGAIKGLDHAVSFITESPVTNGKSQIFKNKEAIIIDPQLGITDYAGNYFVKLKEIMGASSVGNSFSIFPFNNCKLNKAKIAELRTKYPELVINSYSQVKL